MKIVLLLMCVALGSGNHGVKRSNEFDDAYDYSEADLDTEVVFVAVTSTTNKNEELSRSSTILPITDRTIPVSTLVTENWEEAVVVEGWPTTTTSRYGRKRLRKEVRIAVKNIKDETREILQDIKDEVGIMSDAIKSKIRSAMDRFKQRLLTINFRSDRVAHYNSLNH
ncbi:uncharacterized protein LOC119769408 isoform X2 [Culex quinquefasciatus]|uniref:uncharacterized protein LOC119769408 isoform X2 n=1 Tax=Culex quinquefasciatus TaxID=7176 RepID=UPI0018E2C64D|nr:uncharacterized protein LOC119769408 isoform X2 [Culex quinquefasciatus]